MIEDQQPSGESASDKLAAFLRDCIIALVVLAMIAWLIYFGIKGITTGHLDLGHGIRPSRRWFTRPLDGRPAMLAGFSLLSLAAAFLSVCTSHPWIRDRVPSWIRVSYWFFFAGWAVLYFTARFMSHS
jgi:hypothetical protein